MRSYGLYVNGNYIHSAVSRDVRAPFADADAAPIAKLAWLGESDPAANELIEAALLGAHETFAQIQRGFFGLDERLAFLERLKTKISNDSERLALTLAHEIGKPLSLARTEIARAVATVEWTIREAPEVLGARALPTNFNATSKGLEAWSLREPRGPMLAIAPFNFPFNLALHKVVPAIAAGCPVILKPSPKAALTGLAIADLCHTAELPAGMLSVLNCDDALTRRLAGDTRMRQISFTGSTKVGWSLAKENSDKPVHLELGGTAPCFVDASADLENAAKKLVQGSFAFAGQVCISTQNISVHEKAWPAFREIFAREVRALAWGLPTEETLLAGSVIDAAAADRLRRLRESALAAGAKVLAEAGEPKGAREGGVYVRPAAFENVPPGHALCVQETFGPFVSVKPVENLDRFVAESNAYSHRFQASVFTADLKAGLEATRRLDYGAVLVNEPTTFRLEPMPFGGRGLTGTGREGPRYAMEAFSDLKSVAIRP
jgi:glyceraldehyde-3-phosphate dehydrogenase (NADP+)